MTDTGSNVTSALFPPYITYTTFLLPHLCGNNNTTSVFLGVGVCKITWLILGSRILSGSPSVLYSVDDW